MTTETTPTYTLVATSAWDDGDQDSWTYYDRNGTAQDAYAAMKRRWREARYDFIFDDSTLTLTRRRDDDGSGPYTDTLTYVGGDSR